MPGNLPLLIFPEPISVSPHKVLEGKSKLEQFRQNKEIVLQVVCKKDATEKLEEKIPYGLAVTLEVAEESQISVYEKVRQRLSQQIEAQEEL